MFTTRQAPTENAMFSTVGVLIFLAAAGQHVRLADGLHSTTLSLSPSDPMPITQAANDSMGKPRFLALHHAPCRDEHADFCANGGTCMYPQDMDKPSCWCKASFSGQRCMTLLAKTHKETQYEEVVGICAAVVFFLVILIVFLWWLRKRCIKKSPQKYGGPETSV